MNIPFTMKVLFLFLASALQFGHSYFIGNFRHVEKIKFTDFSGSDSETPLILTPYLEQNQALEARNLSAVHIEEFGNVESYSGFLTVNKKSNSNLFFWFFPAQVDYKNAPVVLWLQGGPGGSSLYGLFEENGPFEVKETGTPAQRNYSWTEEHSVLYIDNPAGTGFSFTNSGGYCTDEVQVGKELYTFLIQFFKMFPELRANDFFFSFESYAGKYVPAISYRILKQNQVSTNKINLKGLAIGDGWSDPIHQLEYSDYLYQIGLIDDSQRKEMEEAEKQCIQSIINKQWKKANFLFKNLMIMYHRFTLLDNYNYLIQNRPDIRELPFVSYLNLKRVKASIHVGNLQFQSLSAKVYGYLSNDMSKSVAPWISELLSHYRVLIYNGQLDVIVPYRSSVSYLQNLNFSSAEEYKTAPRRIWYVGEEVAGYSKTAGNLTELLVRNAGHMVPSDQPKWAYDMIYRFTRNKSFN